MDRAQRLGRFTAIAISISISVVSGRAWADAPAPAEAAHDDPHLICFTKHDEAQIARRERHLLAARAALRLCSAATCRDAIRADCIEWLEQVDRSVPSVVVSARARGEDLTVVKVFVDGTLAADRLTGAALELDPGQHEFRFQSPRWPPITRSILVSEGVKNRPIDVEFAPAAPPPAAVAVGVAARPPPRLERHLHRFDYVAGGIGLAALGTGAAVGTWALIQHHELQRDCAPFCSNDQKSALRTKLVIADVSFGIAAAALLVTGVHYFRSDEPVVESSPPRLSLLFGGGNGAAGLGLAGAF